MYLVAPLVGCGSGGSGASPEEAPDMNVDPEGGDSLGGSDPVRSDGGGTSGSEGHNPSGTIPPCAETETLVPIDGITPEVDFSAQALLSTVGGTQEVAIDWYALDGGPQLPTERGTLTVRVDPRGDTARAYHCDDPDYPPERRLEVDVTLGLESSDGRLDETIETTLVAERVTSATLAEGTLSLLPEQLNGTLGGLVGDYYDSGQRDVLIDLTLREGGPAGLLMGPFSPHPAHPCREAAYATWPAGRVCLPDQEAFALEEGALEATLDQTRRKVALMFSDGTEAVAEVEVTLRDELACSPLSTRIDLRLRSPDAGIDLATGGWLSSHTDADTGVEHITVETAVALDADSLQTQLGYDGDARAAIVSFEMSVNPNIVPPVPLQGGFRVREIDRAGFETPLPEVVSSLPGVGVSFGFADSERCFDAGSMGAAPWAEATVRAIE